MADRDPWSWQELWKQYRAGPKVRGVEFDDFLYERMLRLRQINAELLVACESLLRWAETSQTAKTEGKAEHDDVVKGRARAAIVKATAKE